MPLPTMTSGRSADRSTSNARSTSSGIAWVRGGSGQRAGSSTLSLVDLSGDDVVRHVEIARAGPAVDRVPDRHLDIERDAVDVLDRVGELAERRGDQHLALFLERPHAVAPGLRRAADEDHRPAVLLRIGEAGEGVDDAGARHHEAGARAPGQIANGLRGIRGGLLVAHPDVGNPFLLRGRGDRLHRKPDDPEHELDALPFEAPRH